MRSIRSYIADIEKYCNKKGNECLIKTPCYICRRIVAPFCRVAYAAIIVETLSSHLRKDKYNKKIQKFLVDVDDDEEDYGHDEERETQESETEDGFQEDLLLKLL